MGVSSAMHMISCRKPSRQWYMWRMSKVCVELLCLETMALRMSFCDEFSIHCMARKAQHTKQCKS